MAILTVVDSNPSGNIVEEGVAGTPALAIDINASGGSGNFKYSIGYDPTGGGFSIDQLTGIVSVADGSLIDYEALLDGKLTLTIHVADVTETENFGDINVVIDVDNADGEVINGTTGIDEIDKSGTKDFDSTDEEDSINGLAGDDIIDAAGGNDFVDGGDDDDDINGGDGDDFLFGGDGDDIIVGGDGDDFIEGGTSATVTGDDLDGGDGIDTLSYEESSAGVTIDLKAGTASDGDAEDDTIANFENVIGSALADKISGADADDIIEGGAGADELDGQGDDINADFILFDTVSYASSSAGVTVTLGKQGVTTTGKGGDAQDDKIVNFENILGSAFADTLTLSEEGGNLEGGAGADILNGGSDLTDNASYFSSNAGVTITLGKEGKTSTGSGGHAQGDKITGIESLAGSHYNDKLTGNELDNDLGGGLGNDMLSGAAGDDFIIGDNVVFNFPINKYANQGGNDTLDGGDGDDYLQGGIGSDTIIGGAGVDTASYQGSTKAVTIELGAKGAVTTQTGGDAAGDKISLVENIIGTDFADIIKGNELDNLIEGGAGADKLTGSGGIDTVSYDNAPDFGSDDTGVTVDLTKQDGILAQDGDSDEDGDILVGFENIIGSFYDDELTGDGNANIIEGGGGKDVMDGGAGDDIVSYEHADKFGIFEQGVEVSLDSNGDLDIGAGSNGTDADDDQGTDFEGIIGSKYGDILGGNSGNNVLLGLDGDDEIAGGGGNDTLDGGDGIDTLDYSGAAGAVTVTLGAENKFTTVTAAVDGDDAIANFENVIGTAAADTLNGSATDNIFAGGGAKDVIDGNGGIDTVDYSDAATAVTVVLGAGGKATDVTGGDTDTISEIENIIGSDKNDELTGNALNNRIEGGAGDDIITGGAGADVLIGGDDDDTFKFSGTDGIGDTIDGGAGTDALEIGGSVAATLENFSASAGSIEEFHGNGKGVIGTAKNNVLDFSGLTAYTGGGTVDGLAGNDVIKAFASEQATFLGGVGEDTLIGGDKADTLDGGDGDDSLFGGLENDVLTGGKGDDHLVGGANNDALTGGAGADRIDGGDGDDTINVSGTDAQDDTIIGGNGTDTILVAGTATVIFSSFNAAGNSINVFTGAGGGIGGTDDDNVLSFVGATMSGVTFIDGGKGNDTISASNSGNVIIRGGEGDDTLTGGTGIDTLDGGKGIDVVNGGDNDDTILISGADAQFDKIDGGNGTNTLRVEGSAIVTLNAFNATGSNIDVWTGNSKNVVGDSENNVLNFAGLTSYTQLSFIDGAAGDDTLTASNQGNDLRGGAGNDTLTGGTGKDTLNGGAGNDTINGGDNNDSIQITGSEAQFDTLIGGVGDDSIDVLGSGAVTLDSFDAAGAGIEFWNGNKKGVVGNAFANAFDFSGLDNAADIGVIDGAGGNDAIIGSDEDDDIRGGIGNDNLNGFKGNDTLNGGTGIDTISGGDGNDTIAISGTEGQFDILNGDGGTDTLSFVGASVTLDGFNATTATIEILSGKSTAIIGNAGANTFDLSGLTAVSGLKSIDGGAGDDTIIGVDLADFADDLRGNAGNDALTGGKGNDKLAGGSAADTFVFDQTDFGKDTISDFGSGFDILDFSGTFATDNDVLDAATQVGANVVITFDDQNTVTLLNYTIAQLEALSAGQILT